MFILEESVDKVCVSNLRAKEKEGEKHEGEEEMV